MRRISRPNALWPIRTDTRDETCRREKNGSTPSAGRSRSAKAARSARCLGERDAACPAVAMPHIHRSLCRLSVVPSQNKRTLGQIASPVASDAMADILRLSREDFDPSLQAKPWPRPLRWRTTTVSAGKRRRCCPFRAPYARFVRADGHFQTKSLTSRGLLGVLSQVVSSLAHAGRSPSTW